MADITVPVTGGYYTIQDLMVLWQMKEGFIRNEIRCGRLKCTHFGRSVRVSQQQVNDYLNNYTE